MRHREIKGFCACSLREKCGLTFPLMRAFVKRVEMPGAPCGPRRRAARSRRPRGVQASSASVPLRGASAAPPGLPSPDAAQPLDSQRISSILHDFRAQRLRALRSAGCGRFVETPLPEKAGRDAPTARPHTSESRGKKGAGIAGCRDIRISLRDFGSGGAALIGMSRGDGQ